MRASFLSWACWSGVVAAAAFTPLGPARAAENPVVAVVACDGYADLKKQVGWVGTQVGNPTLAAFAESFVMMATQFKGLAGLDVSRPLGVVVTADGETPVIHGYVPVKDLDKLLETLQGTVGPAAKVGGKRTVQMPGGPLEITEQGGWAIVTPQGSPAGPANAEQLISAVSEALSIGVQLFPAAMPEGMRGQVRGMIEQGAAAAADQGQPLDAAAIAAAFDGLADTEYLLFGLAVEPSKDRLFIENRTVMLAGTDAAAVWSNAGQTANALGVPTAANGKPATVRAHHAQAVPPAARVAIEATLAQVLPAGTGDPISDSLFGLLQDLVAAMLDAGALDAGLAIDTSAATTDLLLPAVTLSARIKDGPALEKQVKNRLGNEGSLPPQATVRFDAGRQAGANLHEIEIDLAGVPEADKLGRTLNATLAVTADRAFLLVGGDVAGRLAAAMEAGGRVDGESKPLTGIDISVASLLAYAATMSKAANPDDPAGVVLSDVARDAVGKPSTLVQLLLRPIERGVAMRLTADAGAVQTIAAAVTAQQKGLLPGGALPLPDGLGVPAIAP
jgi:hypothetical protein